MTTLIYAHPSSYNGGNHELSLQHQAMKTLATMRGIEPATAQGDMFISDSRSGRDTLHQTSERLQAGDTLIVASIEALGDSPSEVLKFAGELIARGVSVLVAEVGGELDLGALRLYSKPFQKLEQDIAQLEADMEKLKADQSRELDEFISEYQQQITKHLMARGVDLTGLLTAPVNPGIMIKEPARPDIARNLRELRAELGLTQEEAGKLYGSVFKGKEPLTKVAVSRMESSGTGKDVMEYGVALRVERGKRRSAEKDAQRKRAANPTPHELQAYRAAGIPSPAEEAEGRRKAVAA
jgi:DNA invertase Pin-like site-specific DNA recombinase